MIKIALDSAKKNSIEETHWKWFQCHLKKKIEIFPYTSCYHYIRQNVELLDSNEKKLPESKRRRLYHERLKKLVVGNFYENTKESFDFFVNLNPKKSRLVKKRLQAAFGYEDFSMSPGLTKWKTWYNKNKNWYDLFMKKNNGEHWNTKVLCEKMGVDVCPYCNRQYIYTYERDDENVKKNSAEVDHFKPKSKYPFFSCSLYNMVPSCSVCNSIKRDQDKDIVYPYGESFEKGNLTDADYAVFRLKRLDKKPVATSNMVYIPRTVQLDVFGTGIRKDRILNSKKMFALDELYSMHKLDLDDLLLRYNRYGKCNKKALCNLLKVPEAVMKRVILGLPLQVSSRKEFVLRKFKEDLISQLDAKK